jgi:hypothetical protein
MAANVVSLRLRAMPPVLEDTGLEAQYPAYPELVEVTADDDVVLRTESDLETSGPQTRFFVVGRRAASEGWLVVSIGTGP